MTQRKNNTDAIISIFKECRCADKKKNSVKNNKISVFINVYKITITNIFMV